MSNTEFFDPSKLPKGEVKIKRPKKETVYLICGTMKDMRVEEAKGEVIEIIDNYGFKVKLAVLYRRPYYFLTHYESGLECTPIRTVDESGFGMKDWRNKDELIERIKQYNFEQATKRLQVFKDAIKKYKEEHKQ